MVTRRNDKEQKEHRSFTVFLKDKTKKVQKETKNHKINDENPV